MCGCVGFWERRLNGRGWSNFCPMAGVKIAELCRSATASTFMASLELARQGKLDFRQAEPFSPLEIKGKQA